MILPIQCVMPHMGEKVRFGNFFTHMGEEIRFGDFPLEKSSAIHSYLILKLYNNKVSAFYCQLKIKTRV